MDISELTGSPSGWLVASEDPHPRLNNQGSVPRTWRVPPQVIWSLSVDVARGSAGATENCVCRHRVTMPIKDLQTIVAQGTDGEKQVARNTTGERPSRLPRRTSQPSGYPQRMTDRETRTVRYTGGPAAVSLLAQTLEDEGVTVAYTPPVEERGIDPSTSNAVVVSLGCIGATAAIRYGVERFRESALGRRASVQIEEDGGNE